jgi:hypothetical protein
MWSNSVLGGRQAVDPPPLRVCLRVFFRGRGRSIYQFALGFCGAMVINHRTGEQEMSSLADRTMPRTVEQPNVKVATRPRY